MAGPGGTVTVAQVMIALPGATPMSGEIAIVEGEKIRLDDVAIQLHGLVNDIVQSIRANKVIVDGEEVES